MDHLPVEIAEKIFRYICIGDNPRKLYKLRYVSKAWKFQIDQYTSRTFKIWYNICKKEIPKKYLDNIIKARYPLLANPGQTCFWKDSEFPHVVQDAYRIWKFLITLLDRDSVNPSCGPLSTENRIIRFIKRQRFNDEDGFAISREGQKSRMLFCRWENLGQPCLKYHITYWKIFPNSSKSIKLHVPENSCDITCLLMDSGEKIVLSTIYRTVPNSLRDY